MLIKQKIKTIGLSELMVEKNVVEFKYPFQIKNRKEKKNNTQQNKSMCEPHERHLSSASR